MLKDQTIGFIGAGQMGGAILKGLLACGKVPPRQIWVAGRDRDRLAAWEEPYGVHTVQNGADQAGVLEVMERCGVVVVGVKPQAARPILEAAGQVARPGQVIVSILGGVTLEFLEGYFPQNPVLRVMPNVPMAVGKGIAGIAAGKWAKGEAAGLAVELFETVGKAYLLDEPLIDALTSISGCGPAFAALFAEALADGGVEMGLPRPLALQLAAKTLVGTGELMLQQKLHPAVLKDSVCSPAGGTIAGVHALEQGGLRAAVMNAVEESCLRMIQVGKKA